MPGWTLQAVCFVHHDEVDAGSRGLLGEPGAGREALERDHDPLVRLEGVELGAQLSGDVAEVLHAGSSSDRGANLARGENLYG